MKALKLGVVAASMAVLAGCAAKHEVSHFQQETPKTVCIAKHNAVKEGVVTALEEAFAKHNVNTQVIEANYVMKHQDYQTSFSPADAKGCDAVAFYTAHWRWDLALYMAYANIWVTDVNQDETIAQASYLTGNGLDKFIDAHDKIVELVDSMFAQVEAQKLAEKEGSAL